jgi:acylphosphatase
MQRTRVVVRGVVQGVGFRYAARAEAESRGVSGWVRNRSDGAVEAEIEGAAADVDALVGWMRLGPPGAEVTDVEVSSIPTESASPGLFRVLPTK